MCMKDVHWAMETACKMLPAVCLQFNFYHVFEKWAEITSIIPFWLFQDLFSCPTELAMLFQHSFDCL